MKGHYRTDRASMGSAQRTADGFLRVPATLAIEGVYQYTREDGTVRREYVSADVLRAAIAGIPVTLGHPDGMVTPGNARELMRGVVTGTIATDRKQLDAELVLHDAGAIEVVEKGVRELSCGYYATVEDRAGVWVDEAGVSHAYDTEQTGREYNHVAIVVMGRHGSRARVHLDGRSVNDIEEAMKITVRIDGIDHEIEVTDAAAGRDIKRAIEEGVKAKAETEKLQGKADALEADLAKAKAEAEKVRTDSAITPERLTQRLVLIDQASRLGVDRDAAMKLDEAGLRRAAVQKRYPDMKLDGRSDEAIAGMYELAVADMRTDGLRQTSPTPAGGAGPAKPVNDGWEAKHQKWQADLANAHRATN
jgi:hypothetical protein